MTRILGLLLSCALAGLAVPARAANPPPAGPQTEADKTAYAIGQLVSGNLKTFNFTRREIQMVQAGLGDGLKGVKSPLNIDEYRAKAQALQTERMAATAAKAKEAGNSYREQAAKDKDTETTPSGIIITTLAAGAGAAPSATDQVKVNYEGALIDGTVFDSSIKRGQPMTFKLSAVVPCWTEALQHMKVGGKARIVCPPESAYRDRGQPPTIPGGSTLVFNVELLDIVK